MLIHPEVADALADGRAVIALESTIISHGLPRPDNLRIAREIEAAVRAGGAVPATIAVVDGQARIDLDDAALERVAGDPDVEKVSVRDLAAAAARAGPARPPSRRPRPWVPGQGSGSSPPVGSAACTAARATPGTSRPT